MSNEFSEKVKLIRKYSGLSQDKFTDATGIPLSSYKRYETGNTPNAEALKSILNYKDYKKFTLWLMTDETDPSIGQISPDMEDVKPQSQKLTSKQEFHDSFVSEIAESMKMFGYLGWIEVNTDKIDFEACGKLVLKEVEPIIENHFGSSLKSKVG